MTYHVARSASRANPRVSSETWMMAECESVVLASLVAQVRGVTLYGLQVHGARLAEQVMLVRRPDNKYTLRASLFCCVTLSKARTCRRPAVS